MKHQPTKRGMKLPESKLGWLPCFSAWRWIRLSNDKRNETPREQTGVASVLLNRCRLAALVHRAASTRQTRIDWIAPFTHRKES